MLKLGKKNKKNINILAFLVFFMCLSSMLLSAQTTQKNINIITGTPVSKKTQFESTKNYIIERTQYVLSYNSELCSANWASWHLSGECFGKSKRYKGAFITDTTLPAGFYRVKHSDYTNSGYDRGHIVRSEERTRTVEDNISTFLLTNIIPQTPDLNRGIWFKLESFCKELCLKYNKQLVIISGGIYSTDTLSGKKIRNKISIPDSCWKIVLMLDKSVPEDEILKYITAKTEVIAVVMPNISGIRKKNWEEYLTTVREIEHSTEFDFFTDVPIEIQNVIEKKQFENIYKISQ